VLHDHPGFARGAAGWVQWGGKTVGQLGKIDRAVAEKLSLRDVPAAAELDLTPLLEGAELVPQLRPFPTFPAAPRDLSLDVPESVRYEQIESVVRGASPQYLEAIQHVSTYRGKPLAKGKKSVTITLVFRSPTGTLTGEEVEASVKKV